MCEKIKLKLRKKNSDFHINIFDCLPSYETRFVLINVRGVHKHICRRRNKLFNSTNEKRPECPRDRESVCTM